MSPHYYDRTIRPACLVEGSGRARDALHDVVQSMHAITVMMSALIAQGEDRRFLAEGVYKLLDQQCAMLNGVFEELGAEDDARQSSAPTAAVSEAAQKLRVAFIESNTKAGIDPGLIGTALNLPEEDVQRVVGRLRGEVAASSKPAARAARA